MKDERFEVLNIATWTLYARRSCDRGRCTEFCVKRCGTAIWPLAATGWKPVTQNSVQSLIEQTLTPDL